jgi:glucose-1-phosphate thymidylyltransferase
LRELKLSDINLKALILAAGEGRRMRPLSTIIPKPLLPLLNRPLLEWSISSFHQAGINEIGVVISPAFPQERLASFNCEWFIQEKPLGVGTAILEAEDWLDSPSFLVCAGDSVFSSEFIKKFFRLHLQESPTVTIATEIAPWPLMGTKSCVVLDPQGDVQYIIEKPTKEQAIGNLAAASIFMFEQSMLTELKTAQPSPRGEIEVQATIQSIIERGGRVASMESTRWFHLSDPHDLFYANMRLLEEKETSNLENMSTKQTNRHSPVVIASSADIAEDVSIGPRAVIGERVRVASGVELRDVVVLPDTRVQASYSNGILWSGGFLSISREAEK